MPERRKEEMPDRDVMVKRQQVLADFGDFAIHSEDFDDVLTEACRLVGEALDTNRAKILEIQEGGRELLMRAGVGWQGDIVGKLRLQMSERSSETFSIAAGEPVITQDIAEEDRFDVPAFLKDAGVVAFVNVPIFVPGARPYGILQVDSTEPRKFDGDDVQFLRTYATVLGPVIDRLRLADERRRSDDRLRQFGEASQDVLWLRDADTLQWTYLTPAFETIYGLTREEALTGNNYRNWLELIVPEDRAIAKDAVRRVRLGERVTFDYRIRRPVDGTIRWLRDRDFPLADQSGEITVFGGVGRDMTEFREAELRLRTLVDGIPQLVWRAVKPGEWAWASRQWAEFTGQAAADSQGWGWLEQLHPDDHAAARTAWSTAIESGGFEIEYRIRHAASDSYRWFQTRVVPVRDDSGAIVEWLGTSNDIDDLRTLQSRQQVLVTELQHRTFNLMGMVRSMADATVRTSSSLDDFKPKFRDRVDALARVQRLLSRLNQGERVLVDDLIRNELSAVGALGDGDDRVSLQGPHDVALRSSSVQTFAMAIHELTTNAVKYGALKQPGGHLHIGWRLDDADDGEAWLHVDWRESGVAMPPADAKPGGTGQGRTLIEKALPYQLHARTTYEMGSDGVRCSIALPLPVQDRPEGGVHG